MCKCANVQMCKCKGNVQMCKCANVRMFEYLRVQRRPFAHLHILTFAH